MATILWLIAVVLVIADIVQIVRGGVLPGIVMIVVGLLVVPGGVSIFPWAFRCVVGPGACPRRLQTSRARPRLAAMRAG